MRGEYGSRESKRQSFLRKELTTLALLQSGSLTSRKEELRHPCHVEALAETSQYRCNSKIMRFLLALLVRQRALQGRIPEGYGLRPQNAKSYNVTNLLTHSPINLITKTRKEILL